MAKPFEKFLDFSRLALWQKKNTRVLGIDIGSASVKVVQLRRDQGMAVLETYGEMATGPYKELAVGQVAVLPADKLAELLKDLFREANVTSSSAAFAVPLSSSLLMVIDIPQIEEGALGKVVPIEARKYIPVPISEVAMDWWLIPSQRASAEAEGGTRQLEVLVVAIHNTLINQYQELSQAVGVEPVFLELETFSSIRSIFGGDMSPTALLDLGAATTKLAIVDYGIVRMSHTIGKGAQDITLALSRALGVDFAKAEEIKRKVGLVERYYDGEAIADTLSSLAEYIFAEAAKAITVYQTKHKKAVGRIILSGGGAMLRGLTESAGRSFEVPVMVARPFEKVKTPAFLSDILNEAGPGFAVAIGLALRHLENLE